MESRWFLGAIFGFLMLVVRGAVALDYSGTCTGTIPAGNHNLVGSCTVPSGQMLTIEAAKTTAFTVNDVASPPISSNTINNSGRTTMNLTPN